MVELLLEEDIALHTAVVARIAVVELGIVAVVAAGNWRRSRRHHPPVPWQPVDSVAVR